MKNVIPDIKKYSFFDINTSFSEVSFPTNKTYSLSDISISEIKHFNANLYLSCRIKKASQTKEYTTEPILLKLFNSTVLCEYNNIFNRSIFSFYIREVNNCSFIYLLGADFKEITIGNDKTFILLNSLKIIFTNPIEENKNVIIKTVNLMKYTNIDNKMYQSNDFIRNIEPISNITSFDVSDNGSYAAIGLEKGEVILISEIIKNSTDTNSIEYLPKATNDNITNVLFSKTKITYVLYVSTLKEIYYYTMNNKKSNELKVGWGALSGCIMIDSTMQNKIMFLSPNDWSICEYENYEKGSSWLFEGKKNALETYKENVIFIKENNILVLYDKINRFYTCYQTFEESRILSIAKDEKNNVIYCLKENTAKESKIKKEIIVIKEISSQSKLEQFYKNKDFITAISYSKIFPKLFSKMSLCETFKAYGDFLYSKGDYKNAINQYCKTVKFISPSFIIQLFLDGSKMNYLISYLEILVNEMLISSASSFNYKLTELKKKEFIELLLNCYIKQKQYKKLKDFVENAYINQQKSIAKYAIEICKETKQNELAYSIAEKGKMNDILIQLLIEDKKDYDTAIDSLKNEKNILLQFELLIKFGEVFIDNCPEKFQSTAKDILLHFINIKNDKEIIVGNKELNMTVKKIKYEEILKVFISGKMEKIYEDFLDFIIENDKKCRGEILHRKIEILLKHFTTSTEPLQKKKYNEGILNIIKTKKNQIKLDKNYLMLLFKTNSFSDGIIILSEIMEDKEELLEIYKDTKNFEKIIQLCDTYGNSDTNIYIQSLYYFIDIYNKEEKESELIEYYINILLNKIYQKELMSSILILEISKKLKNKIKFKIIKTFILNMMKSKQLALESDKKEKDFKFERLKGIKKEIASTQMKQVIIFSQKCNLCNKDIKPKANFVCFVCQHSYHFRCITDPAINKDIEELECPRCKNKNNQLTQRMRQSEEKANDHNNFFMELKSRQKKFELIAKYLGKGIFKLDE